MNATESLDFLREKLVAAHERCIVAIDGYHGHFSMPTMESALNVFDQFVAKGYDDEFLAKTPVWSPLFPFWWWAPTQSQLHQQEG